MKSNTIVNYGYITVTLTSHLGSITLAFPYVRERTYDARLESYRKMKKFSERRYKKEVELKYGKENPLLNDLTIITTDYKETLDGQSTLKALAIDDEVDDSVRNLAYKLLKNND